MTMTVYELAGAGEIRHSPYCWRTLLALKHKGFDEFERVPVYFRDRSPIAFTGQGRIPVLVDGDRWINDSWEIACYLEDTYPDRPSLFGGDMGRAEAQFINSWVTGLQGWAHVNPSDSDTEIAAPTPGLFGILIWDVFENLHPADQKWWREDREKQMGRLEDYREGGKERAIAFRPRLEPLRATLAHQPFICGATPAYADYIVFGEFMWARLISELDLLEKDDPIFVWRERLLDLFGGFARAAPGVSTG